MGQRNLLPGRIDGQDFYLDFLSLAQHAADLDDAVIGKLRNMNQALDSRGNFDKRTEVGDASDGPFHNVIGRKLVGDILPWVFKCISMRKRNSIGTDVNLLDFHANFLANLNHFTGVLDAIPGEFADVNQAFGSTEVNERTKIHQLGDRAFANLAGFQLFQQLFPFLFVLPIHVSPGG